MHILIGLIALMIMIPAGLAGIVAAVHGMPAPTDELVAVLDQFWTATQALAPWCQSLACGLFGLGLLLASAWVGWRGLQSALTSQPKA